MSKMEPTEYLNDRYTAMEERLAVSRSGEMKSRERGAWNKPTLVRPHERENRPPLNQPSFFSSFQVLWSHGLSSLLRFIPPPKQIVRKRLNRPLTLAEKVSEIERRRRGRERRRDERGRESSISRAFFFFSFSALTRGRPFFFLPFFAPRSSSLANLCSRSYRPLSGETRI